VQAGVEVDNIGLLADHPLVEVLEHVGGVAAVGLAADDDGLALQALGDERGVAQADRVADEDDLRQVGRLVRRLRLAERDGRDDERDADGNEDAAEHGLISGRTRKVGGPLLYPETSGRNRLQAGANGKAVIPLSLLCNIPGWSSCAERESTLNYKVCNASF